MRKLLLLLCFVALGFSMTGCGLPAELSGAGDAASQSVPIGNLLSGIGGRLEGQSVGASSVRAMITAAADGWFDYGVESGMGSMLDGATIFKQQYYVVGDTDAFVGTDSALGARLNSEDLAKTVYWLEAAPTGVAGVYAATITISGLNGTVSAAGVMTYTDTDTGTTAVLTYTALVPAITDDASTVTEGTIAGTFADYAIALTYAADGSATGAISEAAVEIAQLSILSAGIGTLTKDGKTYPVGISLTP